MSQVLFSFTIDILCRAILGELSRDQEGRNEMFIELIEENIFLFSRFNLEDFFPSLGWLNSLLGLDERANRNFIKWDRVLSQMIMEHENKSDGNLKDDDFVDVLLSLKKDPNLGFSINDEHIKAILMDMLAAGTDTTYIAFEWALAELVKNPNVMEKLQNEINSIANGKSMINEDDLREIPYLKAVIKEVLRLHPPVPLLLPRESVDNCQIGGYKIPSKSRVIINCWAIARDTEIWDMPNEFVPERFMTNPIDFKGQNFEYIPFGSGRRICPGIGFAMTTIELLLSNLIFRFEWKLPEDIDSEVNMAEAPGLSTKMIKSLYLIPKLRF
ncbi:putative costunolide synthase [Dioscorea sansibarensis]